jgi:amino acid transporter
LFENFSVAFTYLFPMAGIYTLFVLGVGTGGPAYVWLTFIPVIGMLFVALVFRELASHYPVAGALYQYSKFSVGPRYGWFVGWFYGLALLITVAAVASPRGYFNIDWITLLVMFVIAVVGLIVFAIVRPTHRIEQHLHDALEPTPAESHGGEAGPD